MAYKSSPRPTFSEPTLIPYDKVTRYLWGDSEAGLVNDWIYLSSSKIHQLIFGFPAEALYCTKYTPSGIVVSVNPEKFVPSLTTVF